MQEPILTVYCLAYNHEKYIRKTLEGFIMQKTKYPYQVIVHDDASTDATAEIIIEYAEKYPDIILPILQKENQYSKKVPIFKKYIMPLVKGKYIAVCEGDDYWCDNDKLETQISYMEHHPECSMCTHNTALINADGEDINKCINSNNEDNDYNTEDIIVHWRDGICHTSSFLARKEFFDRPKDFIIKGIGDFPLLVYASLSGYIHYFGKIMSCYRVMTPGSWTERVHKNKENYIEFINLIVDALEKMDCATEYKYTNHFLNLKKTYLFDAMGKIKKIFSAVKDPFYRKLFAKRIINKFKK